MDKTGFVYIWYDRYRKMYYIGCHWGTINDGYICSSNRMRDAYRRRPNDFKRRILQTDIFRQNLLEEEYKWLKMIDQDQLGKKYYNLRTHHYGHWAYDPEKRKEVVSKVNWKKGKTFTDEEKEKYYGNNFKMKLRNANLGKKLSDESKMKISKSITGRKLPLEQVQKIADANRGKKRELAICPHCGTTGGVNGMARWHFDKCSTIADQESLNKRKLSDETKLKISAGKKGKTLSKEHREKLSNAHKGKIFSKEHRENLVKSQQIRREARKIT